MDLQTYLIELYQRLGTSEFFWQFVLSAFAMTLFYLLYTEKLKLRQALQIFFDRNVWFHKSTITDCVISICYLLFLAAPSTILFTEGFNWAFAWLSPYFGQFSKLAFSPLAEGIIATVWVTVWIDLATFVIHALMHKIPVLWQLHAVHHSSAHLNIFTTHRQHPLEPLILNIGRGAFAGFGLGLLYLLLPNQTPVIVISGTGAGFFFYMFTVNLHHLHIPVRYPRFVRWVFVSPHIHHLHHSLNPRHFDKNYAVLFSFWDRMFGTYIDEEVALGELRFGISDDPFQHSIFRSLWLPLWPQNAAIRQTLLAVYAAIFAVALAYSMPLGSVTLSAKSGVQSFSIVDRECFRRKNALGAPDEPVQLQGGDMPYLCVRDSAKVRQFLCHSTRHKSNAIFVARSESDTSLNLEAAPPLKAHIAIDRVAGTFKTAAPLDEDTVEYCSGAFAER